MVELADRVRVHLREAPRRPRGRVPSVCADRPPVQAYGDADGSSCRRPVSGAAVPSPIARRDGTTAASSRPSRAPPTLSAVWSPRRTSLLGSGRCRISSGPTWSTDRGASVVALRSPMRPARSSATRRPRRPRTRPCVGRDGGASGQTADASARSARQLLDAIESSRRRAAAPKLTWLVQGPTAAHDDARVALGFEPGRSLHQMRRPLPTGIDVRHRDPTVRPDRDVAEWVAVNAARVRVEPRAGQLDRGDTCVARMDEPWFDPNGFLIHDARDGPAWPASAGPRSTTDARHRARRDLRRSPSIRTSTASGSDAR